MFVVNIFVSQFIFESLCSHTQNTQNTNAATALVNSAKYSGKSEDVRVRQT